MACWVYFLALHRYGEMRQLNCRGFVIGGAAEKEVTGHTGTAMGAGDGDFMTNRCRAVKERMLCWELEEDRFQLYVPGLRRLGLIPSAVQPNPCPSLPSLYFRDEGGGGGG